MKSARITRYLLCALCLMALVPVVAEGDDSASLIETRQEKFKEMGRAMKFMRDGMRRESPPPTAQMQAATEVIVTYAGTIGDWFPPGSGSGAGAETDALDYIWKNNEKFRRLDQSLLPAAQALSQAISGGDSTAIRRQMREVALNCKSCHDSFRAD